MFYLIPATISYLLNAISVLTDKFLLTSKIPNPLVYVFYISCLSLLSVLFIPFTHIPTLQILILASLSTISWTIGAYFLFFALRIGAASRVSPIIGTLVPIFLLIYYSAFVKAISLNELWGAILLILGLVFIIIPYLKTRGPAHVHLKLFEFGSELLAGILFAISYILLKEVYNHVPFLTGLVWSRTILIPIVLIILVVPALRRIVLDSKSTAPRPKILSTTGIIFLVGQTAGGVSGILLTYAISLANPALVNSLQGVQYVFLFLVSLVLARRYPQIFKEAMTKWTVALKLLGIGLIVFGLFMLAIADNIATKAPRLGFTYSPRYALELGLDPLATYQDLLTRLHPQSVRLPVYWDEIEPSLSSKGVAANGAPHENRSPLSVQDSQWGCEPPGPHPQMTGCFDFSSIDPYIQTSLDHNIKITLVVGLKVPRYPECFAPGWTKDLNHDQFNQALFNEIQTVVTKYKDLPNLEYWQVENEPLFPFGVCPGIDYGRLIQEVKLVHQLDPTHPVMVTESGEFGLWLTTAKVGDIIGTTLYRRTLAPTFPDFKSPLPPFFYQFKGMMVHLLSPGKLIFVSELQAEPWATHSLTQVPLADQFRAFPVAELKDNIEFVKRANFDLAYLWGAEWWEYLANKGHGEYLNEATRIYSPGSP